MAGCARGPLGLVVFPRRCVEWAERGAFVKLIDWGCARVARASDGALLVHSEDGGVQRRMRALGRR